MTKSAYKNSPSGRTVRRKKVVSPPFVRLFKYMTTSVAWRSLPGEAVAAFVEMANKYDGMNNGKICMPVRTLARARGISKDTASRSINVLIERGFVEVMRPSGFNVKGRLAAEYRLTMFHCDVTRSAPSRAFLEWQPKNIQQSDQSDTTVRLVGRGSKIVPSQSDQSDCQRQKPSPHSPTSRTLLESTRGAFDARYGGRVLGRLQQQGDASWPRLVVDNIQAAA